MKHTIKIIVLVLILCLLASCVCGCKKGDTVPADPDVSVFASVYPFYAAAYMITENVPYVNLNLLVQPQDGCLRTYQLSDWDLALLSTSDFVIAGGQGLESFESLLYSMGENGPVIVTVLNNMQLTNERAVNSQEDAQSHWMDPNPHIYMRFDSMAEILDRIADGLILIDPENELLYRANLEASIEKLDLLSAEVQTAAADLNGRKVIVMNEALVYAAQEYGLNIDLCYERESGENLFDADLTDCLSSLSKSEAKVILIEKQAPQSLCNALEEAGYCLAYMDVLSTRRANEGYKAYFEALRSNAYAAVRAFEEADAPSGSDITGGFK